jgi:hypothetical protein
MLDTLAVTDFEPLLNTEISFRAANGEFQLTLAEAVLLNQPSPRPVAPFRLTFRSAHHYRLPQGIYELQHPQHGPLQLMMVPMQPDARGAAFEVIFN